MATVFKAISLLELTSPPPDLGSVLKATWLTDPITNAMQPILVEQLNVAVGDIGDDLSVNFLAFERTTDPVSLEIQVKLIKYRNL